MSLDYLLSCLQHHILQFINDLLYYCSKDMEVTGQQFVVLIYFLAFYCFWW